MTKRPNDTYPPEGRGNGDTAGEPASAPSMPPAPATSPRHGDGAERPVGKWVTLAIVGIGVFMATLDSSIVNISLPAIAHRFGVPLNGAIEWVVIAYLLVVAAVLLSVGRVADMIGHKPIWVAGLIVFTLGSALCGAAPSLTGLVGFRAFQGLGGAFLMALSPAMLTTAFPPHERGRALGLNAVIVALGVSTGPTLGGILTESFTWRAIFYVNVPIGIIGIAAAVRLLRRRTSRRRERFDPLGAVLLALGLGGLTLGLSFGQEWGWGSPGLLASLAVGVAALATLLVAERHVAEPVVDLTLFRNRLFAAANVSLVLSFLALFAVSFLLPFYLEELRGFSTLTAGLLLTPLPLTIALIAPYSGSLADRIGTRWLASIGLAVACGGLVLIASLSAHTALWRVIATLVFTGVGQGLFQSPNNSALMGAAPRHRQGVAAGMLATGRVVGQSVSVALAGAIFIGLGGAAAGARLALARTGVAAAAGDATALQHTVAGAFHAAFLVSAAIAAFGVLTSLVRGPETIIRRG
ncbi:MAG: MFS transporter [Deinococcales bacterium]